MKKITLLIVVVTVLSLALTTLAFAADNSKDVPQWFKDMITWRKAQIDKALQDGTITQNEADAYKNRIDQMQKWHEQNGFGPGMGAGGCGGQFNGSQNSNTSFRSGMMGRGSYGMMGGFAQ